jgi:hypothetical protein
MVALAGESGKRTGLKIPISRNLALIRPFNPTADIPAAAIPGKYVRRTQLR